MSGEHVHDERYVTRTEFEALIARVTAVENHSHPSHPHPFAPVDHTHQGTPPPPDPEPEPEPTPQLILAQGYGWQALTQIPSTVREFGTATEFADGLEAIRQGFKGWLRIKPGAVVKHNMGSSIQKILGRSGFAIDGRGGSLTLIGAPLWIESCHHFALVNFRHRGGEELGQAGDCITITKSQDALLSHISTSGHSDEGISSSSGSTTASPRCARISYLDCLIGPRTGTHNYGSLNNVDGLTVARTAFIGTKYRNPQFQSGFGEVIDCAVVDADYGVSVHTTAHVNITNPYWQNVAKNTIDKASTAKVGGLIVPAADQVASLSTEAKAYVKANAGALPHDDFDRSLLATII